MVSGATCRGFESLLVHDREGRGAWRKSAGFTGFSAFSMQKSMSVFPLAVVRQFSFYSSFARLKWHQVGAKMAPKNGIRNTFLGKKPNIMDSYQKNWLRVKEDIAEKQNL